jgi:hypothetical protein
LAFEIEKITKQIGAHEKLKIINIIIQKIKLYFQSSIREHCSPL